MVIVRIMGGLGNQLFQYAAAFSLARRQNLPLSLDLGWYRENPQRSFGLRNFKIKAPECGLLASWLFKVARRYPAVEEVVLRWVLRFGLLRERSFAYDPAFEKNLGAVYLDGYWQSRRYFQQFQRELKADLNRPLMLCPDALELRQDLSRDDSIAVHVRRGDYISNSDYAKLYAPCSANYFHMAVHALAEKVRIRRVYVFSDDAEWARANLRFEHATIFMEHRDGDDPCQDLLLLSACPNLVMSNSTFSWWGGWLGDRETKRIVAPRNWFLDAQKSTHDLYDPGWVILGN